MSNSTKVAAAGKRKRSSPSPLLSDDEYTAFWDHVLAHREAARRMAAHFVARQNVDDVVHTTMVRCVESLPRSKRRKLLLTNDEAFRRWFLKSVRNHGINCGHTTGCQYLTHSHWGVVMEPDVGGRRAGDRPLDRVFARNDDGKYDAPAPVERRPQDDVEKLRDIFREHVADLTPMQREVISQSVFEERKRAEIAERLGISEKTYDSHREAAFRFLRVSLPQDSLAYPELDRSVWYDEIEDLRERCEARSRRRSSDKKRKRSRSEGEPSRSGGDRSKSDGDGVKTVGSPASSAVSPANSLGIRGNS